MGGNEGSDRLAGVATTDVSQLVDHADAVNALRELGKGRPL